MLLSTGKLRVLILLCLIFGVAIYAFAVLCISESHFTRVTQARQCMVILQECADRYVSCGNDKKCASSCHELEPFLPGGSQRIGGKPGVLPRNDLAMNSNYMFDIPGNIVEELLHGNTNHLAEIKRAGQVGYGTTLDRTRFVILSFDSQDFGARPLEGPMEPVLIMTNQGRQITGLPGAKHEKVLNLGGIEITLYE
jgi:hypothetical protein